MSQKECCLHYLLLHSEDQIRIKEALRLLILIFWSRDGKKDWEELVYTSKSVWTSLKDINNLNVSPVIRSVDTTLEEYHDHDLNRELESEFVRLFINDLSGVNAHLYHSYYYDNQKLLMKEPALEMTRLLEMIGMDIDQGIGEPPDHLCIELEYLYFLLDHSKIHDEPGFQDHIQEYTREFMLPWIAEFQKRIPDTSPALFFSQTALIMKNIIAFLGKTD